MCISRRWIGALLVFTSAGAWSQQATFDAGTGVLTLPAVKVGTSTYTSVLLGLVNPAIYSFRLQSASPQVPAGPADITFDASTGVLTVPSVKVGAANYRVRFQLTDAATFTFALTTADLLPPAGASATITFDEATAPVLTGFGGAEDSGVVADPTNAANKVARVVKSASAELWAGTTVSNLSNLSIAPVAFSAANTTMTVRVWSPDAGVQVRLKAENASDAAKSVETEATTTVAGGWETLVFNFANHAAGTAALNLANTYNRLSIFFNFGKTGAQAGGARTYYFDDLTYPAGTAPPPSSQSLPVTFDNPSLTYTLTGFGGAEDSSVVTDPAGGTNKVAKVIKSAGAELWAGTTVSTGANQTIATVPFTAGKTVMSLRVWAPAAGIPVRLKVEDAADATKSVETEAITTVANAWQTLTFNFAVQAAGTSPLNLATTYNKASVFFNFGKTGAAGGAGTYYFDDLAFVP